MQVKEGDWVLYRPSWPHFGRVLWVRGEDVLVDQVDPGTCYTPEKVHPALISLKWIIASKVERFPVESGCRAIRAAIRPTPSEDALTQVGLRAIKDSETSIAAVRADLEARGCRVSVAGSGS